MSRTNTIAKALLSFSLPLFGGCGGSDTPEDAAEESFTVTLVELVPDGTPVVKYGTTTLSRQLMELENETDELASTGSGMASTEQAIGQVACGSTVLRIYSSTGYVGDQLCLSGIGLAGWGWCRRWSHGTCIDYWGPHNYDDVRSLKTGNGNAIFEYNDGSGPCIHEFAYQANTSTVNNPCVLQSPTIERTYEF